MIISRQNRFLNKLGIQQYKLRYAYVLQGKVFTLSPRNTKLIIVTEHVPMINEQLVCDVLHILNITFEQVMIIVPKQLSLLPTKVNCAGWLMGVKSSYSFNGVTLVTVSLNTLIKCSSAKRSLWKQICKYDFYFFKNDK